jgi:NAD(P)-dependent dehydrogenase (short-subunit alcohol dehydrogenase family)
LLIVSSAGANILLDGVAGYHTSKFALCRFAEYLAVDYRDRGLVVISTHPGSVLTDITAVAPPEARQFLKDSPFLGGETLVWLAKEQRPWLSGRFVSCNWDMAELEGKKEDIVKRDLLKFRLTI